MLAEEAVNQAADVYYQEIIDALASDKEQIANIKHQAFASDTFTEEQKSMFLDRLLVLAVQRKHEAMIFYLILECRANINQSGNYLYSTSGDPIQCFLADVLIWHGMLSTITDIADYIDFGLYNVVPLHFKSAVQHSLINPSGFEFDNSCCDEAKDFAYIEARRQYFLTISKRLIWRTAFCKLATQAGAYELLDRLKADNYAATANGISTFKGAMLGWQMFIDRYVNPFLVYAYFNPESRPDHRLLDYYLLLSRELDNARRFAKYLSMCRSIARVAPGYFRYINFMLAAMYVMETQLAIQDENNKLIQQRVNTIVLLAASWILLLDFILLATYFGSGIKSVFGLVMSENLRETFRLEVHTGLDRLITRHNENLVYRDIAGSIPFLSFSLKTKCRDFFKRQSASVELREESERLTSERMSML